jgi:chemotaxis-related protein WspD
MTERIVSHPGEAVRVDDCWNRIGTRGDQSCPELQRWFRCLNCPVFERAAAQLLDRPLDDNAAVLPQGAGSGRVGRHPDVLPVSADALQGGAQQQGVARSAANAAYAAREAAYGAGAGSSSSSGSGSGSGLRFGSLSQSGSGFASTPTSASASAFVPASVSESASAPASGEAALTHTALVFRVADEWLALPTATLRHIEDLRPIHSLPHRRNRVVLGVVNVRGALTVAVSLRELLRLDAAAGSGGSQQQPARNGAYARMLVAAHHGEPVALPVDEVHGVLRYAPAQLKPVPDTLTRASASHAQGIFAWRETTVGLLDTERVFASLNQSLR